MARGPIIRIAAIIGGLFILFSLSTLFRPSVVYVDSQTKQILTDYVPETGKKGFSGSISDAFKNVGFSSPIKDYEKEAELGLAQIEQAKAGGNLVDSDAKTNDNTDVEKAVQAELQNAAPEAEVVPVEIETDFIGKDPEIKATFVTLARNSELYDLIKSIRRVEDRFNRKFHYDWVFLNDEEFTDEFKSLTSAIVSGEAKYGLIPKEHWSYPDWIDLEKAKKSREDMKKANIIYGDSESYRHMCRFESGFFWRNPLLDDYDWYWRVEPGIQIHCDLDYDLFKFMRDNKKKYGFTISIHEFVKTIPTLWHHTKTFMKEHPEYIAEGNSLDFISDDNGDTYNLCHYWSNFEIADLNFWRSPAYKDYFDYLDKTGGFFYERWGDAPVHSIAASLFLRKDEIHYFEDVGYNHGVYTQCPLNAQFRYEHKCHCKPSDDFTFRGYSCGKKWHDVFGKERPDEWVDFQ